MFAIATNALYTTLRRRGTTRQLAGVIVVCVISALLLLPAIVWFNLRFNATQTELAYAEIEVALAYVALWGWVLPLGVTSTYCLFTLPRDSVTAFRIPSPQKVAANSDARPGPSRHQPDQPAPFVFGEDTPWGWLEYRSGNFQGQRLALKRKVITIGRDEDNDIWLDDEMASRHHAELIWEQGQVYLSDCESLNGVSLNRKKVSGSAPVRSNDLVVVGSHHFTFILAELQDKPDVDDDPLAFHTWRSSQDSLTAGSDILPATRPLLDYSTSDTNVPGEDNAVASPDWKETAEVDLPAPLNLASTVAGAMIIRSGEMMGQSFLLDRPTITVGRGIESDVVINDASISRQHVQFSRQADGDYVQDLASRNGTKVNTEPLMVPRRLNRGDVVHMGNIILEYTTVQFAQTTPLSQVITPPPPLIGNPISNAGLAPLKLPSKPKQP